MRKAAGIVEKTKANFQERKEERPKAKKAAAGRPMTAAEAEEIRDTYCQALYGMFGFLDDLMKFTSGGHEDPDIWKTIDASDIRLIADQRLEEAQYSAKAAAGVRKTIARYRKALIGIIVLPRAWQTIDFYDKHGFDLPLKLRKRRKLRVVNATKEVVHEPA